MHTQEAVHYLSKHRLQTTANRNCFCIYFKIYEFKLILGIQAPKVGRETLS